MATAEKTAGHKPVGTDISTARRVSRLRRHNRLRKRVSGTPERPRLVVNRSSRHIHVQLVDDDVEHRSPREGEAGEHEDQPEAHDNPASSRADVSARSRASRPRTSSPLPI